MFDALLNDIFSFVASTGLEELKELKALYTNQQILYLTIKQFAESNLFRIEYRNVAFYDIIDDIMSISSNLISPTLELPQIIDNLSPILEKCFITDNTNSCAHIIKIYY